MHGATIKIGKFDSVYVSQHGGINFKNLIYSYILHILLFLPD